MKIQFESSTRGCSGNDAEKDAKEMINRKRRENEIKEIELDVRRENKICKG
jgi:hypothetical protein